MPGGIVDLPVRIKQLHIQRHNAGSAAPVEVLFVAEDWRDAFWISTAGLLEQFGSEVRLCPMCATVFVKNRKQVYCSKRCERKKRNEKYYRHTRAAKAGRLKK